MKRKLSKLALTVLLSIVAISSFYSKSNAQADGNYHSGAGGYFGQQPMNSLYENYDILRYSEELLQEYQEYFENENVYEYAPSESAIDYAKGWAEITQNIWNTPPEDLEKVMNGLNYINGMNAAYQYLDDARDQSRKKAILETYRDQFLYYLDH